MLYRKAWDRTSLKVAEKGTTMSWFPEFSCGNGGYFFYQYNFNKTQMRRFLAQSHFEVVQEFVGFGDEGILHNFGRLAASWNSANADVDFTFLGKVLRKVIPVKCNGTHAMLYSKKELGSPLDWTPDGAELKSTLRGLD